MKKTKTKHVEHPEDSTKDVEPSSAGTEEAAETSLTAPKETVESIEAEPETKPEGEAGETVDSVEELRARIDRLEDSLLRAKADYRNLERRAAAERASAIRYANAELMKSLLSVVDDFERSLEAARGSDNLQALVEGVRLVYDNLLKAMRAQGLERIEALHEPFDPNVHEAMLQKPTSDYPPGTVVEEVAKGYRLHDRVLRPAKVVVSKEPDTEEPEDTDKRETPAFTNDGESKKPD